MRNKPSKWWIQWNHPTYVLPQWTCSTFYILQTMETFDLGDLVVAIYTDSLHLFNDIEAVVCLTWWPGSGKYHLPRRRHQVYLRWTSGTLHQRPACILWGIRNCLAWQLFAQGRFPFGPYCQQEQPEALDCCPDMSGQLFRWMYINEKLRKPPPLHHHLF